MFNVLAIIHHTNITS